MFKSSLITIIMFIALLQAQTMEIHTQQGKDATPVSEIDSITFSSSSMSADYKLTIVWSSGDPDIFTKLVDMYARNAKSQGWFDEVYIVIWGPSSKLTNDNTVIKNQIQSLISAGVQVEACKACADSYGVSSALESIGIDVKYMGEVLSNRLKSSEWKVITF